MTDETPKTEPKTLRQHLAAVLSTGPLWLRAVVAIAAMLLGAVTHRACTPKPTEPPPAPHGSVVQGTTRGDEPAAVVGAVEARGGHSLLRRVYVDHTRHRLAERLQRDGLALVGGNATPLSPEAAGAAVKLLHDDTVAETGRAVGAPLDGGGPILTALKKLFTWIREHPEEALRILMLILAPFLGL